MPTVDHMTLAAMVTDIYRVRGVSDGEAECVAHHQVESNLVGHDSHGVIKTAHYVLQLESGEIVSGVAPTIESESVGILRVNGNWGFGFVTTDYVARLARAKAKAVGACVATIVNQGHIGRLGHYVEDLARDDAIAILMSDSGKSQKAVVPFGGSDRRLGTNPIAVGIPTNGEDPIVLDMATAAVAEGKISLARARNEDVPLGWIVDRKGVPTQNPNDYFAGGSLLPLGGYKGYGLSFVIEILCEILTGVGFEPSGDDVLNDAIVLVVLDVGHFRDVGEFRADVDQFIQFVTSSPPARGQTGVLYPGELERETRRRRLQSGIFVEESTYQDLLGLREGPSPSGQSSW